MRCTGPMKGNGRVRNIRMNFPVLKPSKFVSADVQEVLRVFLPLLPSIFIQRVSQMHYGFVKSFCWWWLVTDRATRRMKCEPQVAERWLGSIDSVIPLLSSRREWELEQVELNLLFRVIKEVLSSSEGAESPGRSIPISRLVQLELD